MANQPAPDPGTDPRSTGVTSAEPSTGARVLAFLAILVAGVCGGMIGYAVVDLQTADSGALAGLGALVGAVIAAGGTGVVAVLVLRAMTEWQTIEATGDPAAARRAQKDRPT